MPEVVLFQPEPSENPVSFWNFRFIPPDARGFPSMGEAVTLTYDPAAITRRECVGGEWLEPYCIDQAQANDPAPATTHELNFLVDACKAEVRSCHVVQLSEPPQAAGWIEARSHGQVYGISEWSRPRTVPEVDFIFSVFVGVLFIGAITCEFSRETRGRRRPRTLSLLFEHRQRGSIRRWAREMLQRGLRLVGGRR